MRHRYETTVLRRLAILCISLICPFLASTTLAAEQEDTAEEHAHHSHHSHDNPRADTHAPIGVMGEHMHPAGEWMLSYRFMWMDMGGNRIGTDRVPTDAIVMPDGPYMVAPKTMTMKMHMFGLMYAPFDWVTLMAMLPVVSLDMNHVMMNGNMFRTHSDGVGDFKLSGLFSLYRGEGHDLHLNLGASFPTGSIDHSGNTPMGWVRLPYPMQIGSGTYDILPGITYAGRTESFSWGSQVMGVIHTGTNDNHYTLGDRVDVTAWGAMPLVEWASLSARLNYAHWANIDGADPSLNPNVVPTADPNLRAGDRIDVFGGMNFEVTGGLLKGHRFAIELGFPVYQKLDGPQLENDWQLVIGWQKAF